MIIKTKFNMFQKVQLKIDAEKKQRMVIGVSIRPGGLTYALSNVENETWHYEPEIEKVKRPPAVKGFSNKK